MALLMALAYRWARKMDNYGVVDLCWALGLCLAAIAYALLTPGLWQRRVMIATMAGLWALRLSIYLYQRIVGKAEDGRYRELRKRWADTAPWKFFLFFQVQASWDVLFSVPFLAAMYSKQALSGLDLLGAFIWLLALSGESLADYQLARFKAKPESKGQTCSEGLWRYSRHPNYFFEWLHWFAYIPLAWYSPYWYLSLFGPIVMALFLFKLTGIPYTEKQALKSRGENYRIYQKTTSRFIPWFPREVER